MSVPHGCEADDVFFRPRPKVLSALTLATAASLAAAAFAQELRAPGDGPPQWSPDRPSETSIPSPAPTTRRDVFTRYQSDAPPAPPAGRPRVIDIVKYREAPLREAIQLFVEQTGLNIVPSVRAAETKISLYVKNVTPEEALAALATANGLWYRKDRYSGIYYLYTKDERAATMLDAERLEQLATEINEAFPDSFVRLSLVGEQIVVRGQARDVLEASEILKLISLQVPSPEEEEERGETTVNVSRSSLFPNGSQLGLGIGGLSGDMLDSVMDELGPSRSNIVNLLHIPGEQQVALRVTVAEVNRSAARSIGLNFRVNDDAGNAVFQSLIGNIVSGTAAVTAPGTTPLNNLPTLLDNGQIRLAIHALRRISLARTLAEPTLTTLNGKQASFHAGGQFPVPVVTGFTAGGLQGVSFVPFGVELQFTPFVVQRDRVRLVVAAEVSTRDEQLATNIGGNPQQNGTQIQGLNTRNFQTTVELRSGQTLAVAGLIQTSFGGTAQRVPLFGDLPLIGRAAAYDGLSSTEQELVILITPELVSPIDPCEAPPLPGSDVFEPGDVEFYLGGIMEGRRADDYRSSVRSDFCRQKRYLHCNDVFMIGPSGYSCGGLGHDAVPGP